MNSIIVQVTDLRKSYGGLAAVDGISFEVHRGEIFGLLGPNGAGKTTTIECLEGLRFPDSGELRIEDIDPVHDRRQLRDIIGVQLQTAGLPECMTVREAMTLLCAYHHLPPRIDLLERLGLGDRFNAQYGELSAGQERRLALALAIAHRPQVIFLDEPTAGLDVPTRAELHAIVQELAATGTTLILATHDMAEAEKLASRVAILVRGKCLAIGSPRELTASSGQYARISVRSERDSLTENGQLPCVLSQTSRDGYIVYLSSDTGATALAILEYLKEREDPLVDLRVERPSLEDRFLEYVGSKPS